MKNGKGGPTLDAMERSAQGIARVIDAVLNKHGRKTGFMLMLFDFGPNGFATYTSNSDRADMIRALNETRARLENDTETLTHVELSALYADALREIAAGDREPRKLADRALAKGEEARRKA